MTRLVPTLLVLLLGACGGDQRTAGPLPAPEPPQWRIKPTPEHETGAILKFRSPARTRIRIERTGREPHTTPWRDHVAGETVELRWAARSPGGDVIEDRPPPEEAAAGRTQGHAVWLRAHYGDRATNEHRQLAWARPGSGRVDRESALPTGLFEDLPGNGEVELLTLAFGDYAEGRVTLKRRGLATRVVPPARAGEGDRLVVVRVFLDVRPLD